MFYGYGILNNHVPTLRATVMGASIDADALAFITAATITDLTQKSAINTLVTDLKTASIWTKMKAIYPFVGGTATTHKFNLKDPRDLDAAFRLVFNGGWTHSATGALPNGSNGYANTFLTPFNVQTLNSNGIGFYATQNSINLGDPIQMGAINNITQSSILLSSSTSMSGSSNGSSISGAISGGAGLFSVQKTASTVTTIYKNSTLINSGNSGGSLPSVNIYLATINTNNVVYAVGYVNSQFRLTYISDGLNSTDITNLYTAVQKYQTTLGRQI